MYQYLERAYNVRAITRHWEPDADVSEAELRKLWRDAGQGSGIIVWEAEPDTTARLKLADLGFASAVFAPSGNGTTDSDYIELMRQNAGNITEASQ